MAKLTISCLLLIAVMHVYANDVCTIDDLNCEGKKEILDSTIGKCDLVSDSGTAIRNCNSKLNIITTSVIKKAAVLSASIKKAGEKKCKCAVETIDCLNDLQKNIKYTCTIHDQVKQINEEIKDAENNLGTAQHILDTANTNSLPSYCDEIDEIKEECDECDECVKEGNVLTKELIKKVCPETIKKCEKVAAGITKCEKMWMTGCKTLG